MSDHGQGTQIHVTPNCVSYVEAVSQNVYSNRMKKVINQDTLQLQWWKYYVVGLKKSGESSALGLRGDLTTFLAIWLVGNHFSVYSKGFT